MEPISVKCINCGEITKYTDDMAAVCPECGEPFDLNDLIPAEERPSESASEPEIDIDAQIRLIIDANGENDFDKMDELVNEALAADPEKFLLHKYKAMCVGWLSTLNSIRYSDSVRHAFKAVELAPDGLKAELADELVAYITVGLAAVYSKAIEVFNMRAPDRKEKLKLHLETVTQLWARLYEIPEFTADGCMQQMNFLLNIFKDPDIMLVFKYRMRIIEALVKRSRDYYDKETITRFTNGMPMPKKGGGCYIATAVYGSYSAPEVIVLRRFRDEVLAKSILGRAFIKCYYRLSPRAALWLECTDRLNLAVKGMLDRFVRRLERKFEDN